MTDAGPSAAASRLATASHASSLHTSDGTPSKSAARGFRSPIVAALGGLLTALTLIGTLQVIGARQPAELGLQSVVKAELDDAILTLDGSVRGTIGADASQCKIPLAHVTLSVEPGTTGSIRIRSGGYLSPPLNITDAPRRMALPFPGLYQDGRGTMSVEGSARGLNVWLSPGRRFNILNGAEPINVVWTPKDPPC